MCEKTELKTIKTAKKSNLLNMKNKYQTGFRRFGAAILDGLILMPLVLVEDYLILPYENKYLFIFWTIINALIAYGYSVILHAKYGKTFGKFVLRLKVVDLSELENISLKQAFLRDSIGILLTGIGIIYFMAQFIISQSDFSTIIVDYDNFIGLWSFIWVMTELVTMLTNRKRRAVHDFIANTVVIKII